MRRVIILASLVFVLVLSGCATTTSATQNSDTPVATSDVQSERYAGRGNGGRGNGAGGNSTPTTNQPTAQPTPISTDLHETPCLICDVDLSSYTGPLTPTEINALLLALNDEYHAWAVYNQVIADFGDVRPFTSIMQSEASHIKSLTTLLTTYQVPFPTTNPWVGQIPSFASTSAACAAGADAEIVNADLYTQLFASTQRADILQVYQQLQAASLNNHLPAFQRCA